MSESSLLIRTLEAEYDLDTGFLGRLRQGVFDAEGFHRLLSVLQSIHLGQERTIDRRLVALLWLMPDLMTWQSERVRETGGDVERLRRASDSVQEALIPILGMP